MTDIEYKVFDNPKRFLRLLLRYVEANKKLIFTYLGALIFDSFAKMLSVIAIIPLIDILSEGEGNNPQEVTLFFIDILSLFGVSYNLATSVSLFVFIIVLALLAEVLFYFIGRKNAYSIVYYLTSRGMTSFFNRGLKFINSQSFGIIQNTFQREIDQIATGIDSILLMIASIVQMFIMLFLAFSLSASMTFITLAIMLIVTVLISGFNLLISRLSAKTTLSGNDVSQALFEPLMNAKQVLSFGRFDYAFDKHKKKYKQHSVDAITSQTLTFSVPLIFRMFGVIATLIALYFSISSGENTVVLIAALIALIRLTPIAAQITTSFTLISSAVPSLNQFEKLFGNICKQQSLKNLKKFNSFSNEIKLNDISYSHSPTRGSISHINLNIKKNSYVAFLGSSGSGKTTCVDVATGLLKPTSGGVLIDSQPLNDLDLNSFLNHVGYVQQTPFLFNGTIKDNLLWSSPSATEEEIWNALNLANIDDFVRSNKLQLDMFVGDKGVALSGGQKQRIALAQALVRCPDILILDEATNSLDYESEKSIIESLENIKHKVTIITITHHISMAKNADQIFVFNQGSIAESGTYDELMNNPNSFLFSMNS